jgi:hypothetical protein
MIQEKTKEKEIEVRTITNYSYMLFSSRAEEAEYKAVIMITAQTGFLGYINFVSDSNKLPKAVKMYNLYHFYYHMQDMPAIIDMLRNEGPVYLFYQEDDKNMCRISTTMEPVGEGEMHHP